MSGERKAKICKPGVKKNGRNNAFCDDDLYPDQLWSVATYDDTNSRYVCNDVSQNSWMKSIYVAEKAICSPLGSSQSELRNRSRRSVEVNTSCDYSLFENAIGYFLQSALKKSIRNWICLEQLKRRRRLQLGVTKKEMRLVGFLSEENLFKGSPFFYVLRIFTCKARVLFKPILTPLIYDGTFTLPSPRIL